MAFEDFFTPRQGARGSMPAVKAQAIDCIVAEARGREALQRSRRNLEQAQARPVAVLDGAAEVQLRSDIRDAGRALIRSLGGYWGSMSDEMREGLLEILSAVHRGQMEPRELRRAVSAAVRAVKGPEPTFSRSGGPRYLNGPARDGF